ncbi:hypothetical protein F0562_015526 [Nyssa sinensis]|uniref:glucose-1-phosphate adenylyltransferase n=1 Tax=Nyssa sinensis TaxID=561372 RepID=A0A5J4ZJS2_9ASTE|nr:hypothetical protein F0562_015526 [Nyssa sinensis]
MVFENFLFVDLYSGQIIWLHDEYIQKISERQILVNEMLGSTDENEPLQVPIGACYRLIEVPMSNCINSGIRKIFILNQFNSFSLNRHLARTYNFGNGMSFGDGFVEVLAATQTPGEAGKRWFQGTADAVRQFIWVFEQVDTSLLGLSEQDVLRYPYITSIGVYVFRTDVLLKLLRCRHLSSNNFSSEIIPSAVTDHNVQVR